VPTGPKRHLIKKYANRKLYDTTSSRYITLEEIAQLVRDGHEIKVVGRDKGDDLTQVTLSQIVLSEEKQNPRTPAGSLGDLGHERAQALLDLVRRTLNVPAELRTRVERRRGDLEGIADDALESTLSRLRIPTYRDIDRLNERIDALTAELRKLGHRDPATTRPRKRKAAH